MARYSRIPRLTRHRRIRAGMAGTASRPRLAVFRSLKHISCQVIDDAARKTLLMASDRDLPKKQKHTPVEAARAVGVLLAERAKAKGIGTVVFDRGGFAYHGRVQALAEGAREKGLTF